STALFSPRPLPACLAGEGVRQLGAAGELLHLPDEEIVRLMERFVTRVYGAWGWTKVGGAAAMTGLSHHRPLQESPHAYRSPPAHREQRTPPLPHAAVARCPPRAARPRTAPRPRPPGPYHRWRRRPPRLGRPPRPLRRDRLGR